MQTIKINKDYTALVHYPEKKSAVNIQDWNKKFEK